MLSSFITSLVSWWSHLPRHSTLVFATLAGVLLFLISISNFSSNQNAIFGHKTAFRLDNVSKARQKSLRPVLNATLGFESILAINLPERTDHHDGLVLAAAVSDIKIEFVAGVRGTDVSNKVLPPNHVDNLNNGSIGAWRAHINAISQVVENGWASALILEDDVDWDIRLRQQLQESALGSDYVLQHYGQNSRVSAASVQHSHVPQDSPYRDNWDVIWLGHCGASVREDATTMVFQDDVTVPETTKIGSWDNEEYKIMESFPNHTRIITEQDKGTCSLAYAVSQKGARALLFENGLSQLTNPFDIMMREFCEGKEGHTPHRYIAVLPQIFEHYRRKGSVNVDSDINEGIGEIRDYAYTNNVRWSVRLNMEKLLRGETDHDDQYPDTTPGNRQNV